MTPMSVTSAHSVVSDGDGSSRISECVASPFPRCDAIKFQLKSHYGNHRPLCSVKICFISETVFVVVNEPVTKSLVRSIIEKRSVGCLYGKKMYIILYKV